MSDKSSNRPSASSILHAPRAPRALLAGGLAAFAVALPQVAFAADRIWTGGGLLNNNWGNNNNWAGSGGISPLDSLFFGGTSGLTNNNNTAAGTQYNGLTFNSGAGAFTLGGNSIKLGGNVTNNSTATQTINFGMELAGADRTFNAASGNLAINGQISGSKGIVKTGSGTLTLSGDNTYSGGTKLTSGRLETSSWAALGGDSNALTVDGGVLDIHGGGVRVGALSGTGGTITGNDPNFFYNWLYTTIAAGSTSTFSGEFRGDGSGGGISVNKLGEGTLILNGSSSYAQLYISNGTLEYGRTDSLPNYTTIANGATLRAGVAGTLTGYVVVDSGGPAVFDTQNFNVTLTNFRGYSQTSLVKKGVGTLDISNKLNYFDGGLRVDAGTLKVSSDQSGQQLVGGAVVNAGATLDLANAGSYTLKNGLTANGTVLVGNAGTPSSWITVRGTLDGVGSIVGNLRSAGILDGSQSFTGNVVVAGQHFAGDAGVHSITGNLEYATVSGVSSVPSVAWALFGNTAVNSGAAAFDQALVGGNLAFGSATSLSLAFNGAGSTVDWSDAFWSTDRSWTIWQVTGNTTGLGNLALSTAGWQDASGDLLSSIRAAAGFSIGIADNGRDVVLTYSAVPAPGALALLALAGLAGGRRRRGCRA
jgi:autotransporter-associated beta strand protein